MNRYNIQRTPHGEYYIIDKYTGKDYGPFYSLMQTIAKRYKWERELAEDHVPDDTYSY